MTRNHLILILLRFTCLPTLVVACLAAGSCRQRDAAAADVGAYRYAVLGTVDDAALKPLISSGLSRVGITVIEPSEPFLAAPSAQSRDTLMARATSNNGPINGAVTLVLTDYHTDQVVFRRTEEAQLFDRKAQALREIFDDLVEARRAADPVAGAAEHGQRALGGK